MKSELNKQLIESLNESNNKDFMENVNDLVYNLVSSAVKEVSEKSPFVSLDKCILIPANEISTGAFTQLSTYDYFLGIENAQIELNTKTPKNILKFAWREFRASWRVGRKKYKKNKKKGNEIVPQPLEKYQLSDFQHDILMKIVDLLSETSMIYEYPRHISMVGREDFGTNVKVNIYVCCYESKSDSFKLYAENKNKFTTITFGTRFDNISYKLDECGEIFIDMIKILNAMYSKTYNRIPNQILIESLVFNCPNILFDKKDVYKTFVNIANYIRITTPGSISSICNTTKSIFEEKLIVDSGKQVEYSKVINMLDKFKY